MAGPQCMTGDGQPAVFVGTMLQTGDAFTLCDACLVMWTAALLQSMTGVDPTPFLQAISDEEDIAGTEHGAPTDEPPGPGPADEDKEARAAPVLGASSGREAFPPSPRKLRKANGGPTPRSRSSAAAATGGSNDDE
jgi:hypothetical protein